MADVDSVVYTTTERKTRKVKKTTKRRESHDQNAEVTITEVDSTQNNHHTSGAIEEYVLAGASLSLFRSLPLALSLSFALSRWSRVPGDAGAPAEIAAVRIGPA